MLWKLIRSHLGPYAGAVSAVAVLQLVSTVTSLYLPSLNGQIIDDGVAKGDTDFILRAGAIMLGVSIVNILATVAIARFASATSAGIARDLRREVFHRVGDFSAKELSHFGAPTLISRNTNDVQQVQTVLNMGLMFMASIPVMMIGGIFMALREDLGLSWLVAVAVPLLGVIVGSIVVRMLPWFRKMQDSVDAVNRILREQITGIRVVRAFVREDVERERFAEANTTYTGTALDVWIKIDTGYHRAGLLWTDADRLPALVHAVDASKNLVFRGLLTHSGHAYHSRGADNHARLFSETSERLNEARAILPGEVQKHCLLSLGDTPTCTAVENFSGIEEVRPGNFVFFDVQQLMLGSCTEEEISAAVVCPVVGAYPERREAVVYGGAVHLSRQSEALADGTRFFGFAVPWTGRSWGTIDPACYVRDVSQEHGIIRYGKDVTVKPGDLVAVLPVHSCLTMNLLRDSVAFT